MRLILVSLLLSLVSLKIQAISIEINPGESQIMWLGQKIAAGSEHKGTIKIKKGTVSIDQNRNLQGGSLTIDMTSIENQDLAGQWKKKLETHLHSDDFFNTDQFKEAYFKIVKVTPSRSDLFTVTGNLTIRGITHSESFDVRIENHHQFLKATGTIEFDRLKYGVSYNSEKKALKKLIAVAKDQIIKDQIKLELNLKTKNF